jgi:hypothetical protein
VDDIPNEAELYLACVEDARLAGQRTAEFYRQLRQAPMSVSAAVHLTERWMIADSITYDDSEEE